MVLAVVTHLWEPNEASFSFSRCYSEEWVHRLYDGFSRNLTRPFEFFLFTDRQRELKRPITQVQLERRPIGYGSVIESFRLARPSIIVGLDTVVTGNCDAMADYCMTGKVMLLPRDPFFPQQACNGVALVPAGYGRVHAEWTGQNDMEWCRAFPHDLIETRFPGQVESYKGRVRDRGLGDCRIVYFHGKQKPHELPECEWVREHWGPPLARPVEWADKLNNDRATMLAQFRANLDRDLPWFAAREAHSKSVLLVGGGPSLQDTLGKLRFHQSRGGEVWALNGTHDWLIERGIVPARHVLLDSRSENVEFVRRPRDDVHYMVSAYCHPGVFEALAGRRVTLWMSDMDGVPDMVRGIESKPVVLVGGGATVGMKAMFLAYLDGFRKFHFFGFDSSYRDGENHAYRQPMNDGESRCEIVAEGRTFTCAPWMAKQATEFQGQARQLLGLGCRITVHGDGLIPWIMEVWNDRERQRRESVG